MSALLFIWYLSLALSGAAIGIMIVLILARLVHQRRVRRHAARRRELVRGVLEGRTPSRAELRALPRDLVADTFLDLINLVRGDERASFIDQAVELGVADRLGRRARSGSARTRLVAVRSLADFHDENSLRLLHASLDDRNADIRLAAALSLAEAGRSDDIHALVERLGLGTEQDSLLMVTLFRVVAEDRPEEIKALVFNPDTNVQARLAAIEALVATGDYTLVPAIADLALAAPDESEELPRYLRALGMLGHPAARAAVMDGLNRPSMGARAVAASAAGRIGLPETADRLCELLDDPEWWVRFRAAEALVDLGPAGTGRLRDIARSGSAVARDAAATVLAEHGEAA